VAGADWTGDCAGSAVEGAGWYPISTIDGTSVMARYGVAAVYAPTVQFGNEPAWTASVLPTPSAALGSSPGRTLYMSPSGSDTADGLTVSTPFRSLEDWAGRLMPGDTVLVRGGVYLTGEDASETWRTSIGGTPDAPITIRAYPGETPIFDGQGTTQQFVVVTNTSYLTFDGLTIRNYRPVGNGVFVVADRSHHIAISNVTGLGNAGSDRDTDQFIYIASGSHDVLIDRVSVTGTTAAAVTIGGGDAVSNVMLQDSHLYGNGLGVIDGDITVGTVITGNVIENNAYAQVHFHSNGAGHGSTDALVRENTIRGPFGLWADRLTLSQIAEADDCIESTTPFSDGYPASAAATYTLGQWQAGGRGAGTIVGSCR
jgi:hypothetical protein